MTIAPYDSFLAGSPGDCTWFYGLRPSARPCLYSTVLSYTRVRAVRHGRDPALDLDQCLPSGGSFPKLRRSSGSDELPLPERGNRTRESTVLVLHCVVRPWERPLRGPTITFLPFACAPGRLPKSKQAAHPSHPGRVLTKSLCAYSTQCFWSIVGGGRHRDQGNPPGSRFSSLSCWITESVSTTFMAVVVMHAPNRSPGARLTKDVP